MPDDIPPEFKPYILPTGAGIEADAAMRQSHALEFIAARLAGIDSNLGKLVDLLAIARPKGN
jgi:hypothetical protein